MKLKIIKVIILSVFFNFFILNLSATPEIFSPEDFGPAICEGCCDENGNQTPSHPKCGCEQPDKCGVCAGDGTSCGCKLFDCEGNPFPDSAPYCSLDVNKDTKIDLQDHQLVRDYLNSRKGGAIDNPNLDFDTTDDGMVTSQDLLTIVNFLNSTLPGVTKVDPCGVCGGAGPNVCGTCPGTPEFLEPEGPNGICGCPGTPSYVGPYNSECKICTNLGKDLCNRCPGAANYNDPNCCPPGEIDSGCGCGKPGPSGCDNVCGSTKVDLGCGCGVSGPSGCDNVCGSTKVFDKCGSCGGNDSSCECVWAAGWADYSNTFAKKPNSSNGIWELEDIYNTLKSRIDDNQKKPKPACFDEVAKKAQCKSQKDITTNVAYWGQCWFREPPTKATSHIDVCRLASGRVSLDCASQYITPIAEALGVPDNKILQFKLQKSSNLSPAVWWFLDDNCKYVESTPETKLCGFTGYSWSPISLIFKEEGFEVGMNVVEFALSPDKDSKFALWKASKHAPLLVFDPEKTGKVDSYHQLLGNFAFGGKTKELNNYKELKSEPWSNGYEALKIFDVNDDGKLTGDELSSLMLWFDNNRDAKVDEGELVSLADEKVISLYFKNPKLVGESKDLEMEIGFERIVDGKVQSGRTVDWYSETFSSKQEALSALNAMFHGQRASLSDIVDNSVKDSLTSSKQQQTSEHHKGSDSMMFDKKENITGYWIWTLLEKGDAHGSGFFAFGQDENNNLVVKSMAETKLSDNEKKLRSAVILVPGEGHVLKTDSGKVSVNFELQDINSGGNAKTTAELSEDGSTLRGKTLQKYEIVTDGKKRSAQMEFNWIATRMEFESKGTVKK